MSFLKRNWIYLVAVLVIAAVTHVALVAATPHLVMAMALRKMSAPHGINTMLHTKRPDASSRGVVRPSPDLLYSACPFDLDRAGGALRVRVTGMPKSYWSISVFDAETNNIFVLNDRHVENGAADFVVVGPNSEVKVAETTVRSPTTRGLVLIRTLIDDDAHFAAIDAARRRATCGPYR